MIVAIFPRMEEIIGVIYRHCRDKGRDAVIYRAYQDEIRGQAAQDRCPCVAKEPQLESQVQVSRCINHCNGEGQDCRCLPDNQCRNRLPGLTADLTVPIEDDPFSSRKVYPIIKIDKIPHLGVVHLSEQIKSSQ